MTAKQDMRETAALIGDALSQFTKLFQNEVDLAKAELAQKAKQVGVAVGMIGAGAMFIIPALVMLLFAIAAALTSAGLSQGVSYLISAAIGGLIAAILFAIGMNRLDSKNLAPNETIRQLDKDKNAVKGMVR